MKEYRVKGPPGCGKTRNLIEKASEACARWGSDRVMVTTFTKAGAQTIKERNTVGDSSLMGTLHAHCYRILGQPKLAETNLEAWNTAQPALAIKGKSADIDDPYAEAAGDTGGELYQHMNILRAKMIPRESWPSRIRAFHGRWNDWKRQGDLLDFTDLLETCLRDTLYHPARPNVCYLDEAQDSVPLELALVRRWASGMDHLVMAYDDDQQLYSFRGATPEALIGHEISEDHKKVLGHSYRLPQAVHAAACQVASRISYREAAPFTPKDEDGLFQRLPTGINDPAPLVRKAQEYLGEGKTVMFLVSCGYMLLPLLRHLRDHGIPYANPYRPTRGDWNPLGRHGVTAADRLSDLVQPATGGMWTGKQMKAIVGAMEARTSLVHGAKAAVERLDDKAEVTVDDALRIFNPEAAAFLFDMLEKNPIEAMTWYAGHVTPGKRKAFDFPINVARRQGMEALAETPRLIVGTIHSVKGAESDAVFLFPDLSKKGMIEWIGAPRQRDNVLRQFYVGMTRAKEALFMCAPSNRYYVEV